MANSPMMTNHGMMANDDVMTNDGAQAMRFFDNERNVWKCPCEGCAMTYKGLSTLNTHYERKHHNVQKPTWIFDGMTRAKDAKYQARKDAKRVGEVNGMSYQDFKSAQFKAIKTDNPKMSFGDIMKAVSVKWNAMKTQSAPTITPLPIASATFIEWVNDVADGLAERFITEAITEMGDEPSEAVGNMEGAEHSTIEETLNAIHEPCEISNDADETSIANHETNAVEPCDDANDVHNSDDDDYDAELVEFCKTLYEGGFVKAYRTINKGTLSIKRTNNGRYTIKEEGKRPQEASLGDVRDALEDVYIALCDAWYDYTQSDDFNEADCDFDDTIDWLDISNKLVNADNIDVFLDY